MTCFDANTWIGAWPFSFCDTHSARTLATHLRRHGIARALVSPLGAVFAPEPGPANQKLLRTTRPHRALVPVPVINPTLANWPAELARCAGDSRVRCVRLLPNYHRYRLDGPAAGELVSALVARGLRPIVQMQLIDPRHEYHALSIRPVSSDDLAALLKRFRHVSLLASGLGRTDVLRLLPRFPQLLADLSFVEWIDTLAYLREKVSIRQLAFASHTPLLITAAARVKLDASALPVTVRRAVAAENLERFLR
ncbi:MAG TPA: amidohydrolase family protein [Opitutaceae bacterium]|nr:amidohydrolase family protein [Opitutaceae bacterium]